MYGRFMRKHSNRLKPHISTTIANNLNSCIVVNSNFGTDCIIGAILEIKV